MKKLISILLAVTLLAALFVGCGSRGNGSPTNQPSANVPGSTAETAAPSEPRPGSTQEAPTAPASFPLPTEPGIPARVTKEEETAVAFVDALLREEYTAALELLSSSVYPNALVFVEDLKWALPRTDYRVLEYIDADSVQYGSFPQRYRS